MNRHTAYLSIYYLTGIVVPFINSFEKIFIIIVGLYNIVYNLKKRIVDVVVGWLFTYLVFVYMFALLVCSCIADEALLVENN